MRPALKLSAVVALTLPLGAQGLRLLADLRQVERTMDVRGTVYVRADDGVLGPELWRLGPGEQLELVKDIHPGQYGSGTYTSWAAVGTTLFFTAADGTHGTQLWRSDGTASGTVPVTRFSTRATFGQITQFGDGVAFAADDGVTGGQLWLHDPLAGTTRRVTDLVMPNFHVPAALTVWRGALYYLAASITGCGNAWCHQLWRLDAASSVPVLLVSGLRVDYPDELVEYDGHLYFGGGDMNTGVELMATDGTSAGTRVVADIVPGSESSAPSDFTVSGGRLFFQANANTSGWFDKELWAATGSVIARVRDIRVGPEGSFPALLHDVGGTLLFYANDGQSGHELWRSDGTAAGTWLVKDVVPGVAGSFGYFPPVGVDSRLYFVAVDGNLDTELWVTDGSTINTRRVAHFEHRCIATNPEGLASVCGRILFHTSRACGGDLWSVERPGASVHVLGGACGGDARLGASAPRLGSTMVVSGARSPVGSTAVSLLGLRLPQPRTILGCNVYLDVSGSVPLSTFVVTQALFTHSLPLPADRALDGLTVAMQTFFLAPAGHAAATHALCLTLGVP